MSDTELPCQEDTASQTDVPENVVNTCVGTSDRNPNVHGITINFYSAQSATKNCTLKVDKPVQTDNSNTHLVPETRDPRIKKFYFLPSESSEIRNFEYTPPAAKKSIIFSDESKQIKLMNTRKFFDKSFNRTQYTDLERKKLEAELKATEEIAKLQQTVIEKRLALELASLQDTCEYHHKGVTPPHSAAYDDGCTSAVKTSSDDSSSKKHTATDYCYTQEASTNYSPRPSPPKPSSPIRLPIRGFKSDCSFLTQTSSELNPLRNVIEKKINLSKITSKTECKTPNSTTNNQDLYYNYSKQHTPYPPQGCMSCHHYYTEEAEYNRAWWPPDGPYIKDVMKRCLRKIYRGSSNLPETKEYF